MSTIGSGIAASAAQAMVQTNQSAKASDAVRNRDEALAKKMRDMIEQHTHEVENFTEADGSKARIHDEARDHSGRRRRHHAPDQFDASSDSADPQPSSDPPNPSSAPAPSPAEPGHHLDITA